MLVLIVLREDCIGQMNRVHLPESMATVRSWSDIGFITLPPPLSDESAAASGCRDGISPLLRAEMAWTVPAEYAAPSLKETSPSSLSASSTSKNGSSPSLSSAANCSNVGAFVEGRGGADLDGGSAMVSFLIEFAASRIAAKLFSVLGEGSLDCGEAAKGPPTPLPSPLLSLSMATKSGAVYSAKI